MIVALLAGCGGANPQASLPQSQASNKVNVAFSITIPPKSTSAKHRPAYVSTATQSATVTVTPSGESASTPTIINCSITALTCSGTVAAPVGNDTFAVNLYSGTSGGGSLLSTGSLTQTIVASQANSVNVTFNGVVASLAVSLGTATMGVASTVHVTVSALDASGNTIVGPGTYVDASGAALTISLGDTDTSGATTLSTASVSAPGTNVSLGYNGSLMNSAPTISAVAGAINASAMLAFPSGNVTFNYTGAAQTFIVPAGVHSVTMATTGAAGAAVGSCGGTAGLGASVSGTLSITPASELYVYVGGHGFNGGAFGLGGDASDVRSSNQFFPSTATPLTGDPATDPRLIVAGGGGSTGCLNPGSTANGGNAGALGGSGSPGATSADGGGGGGGGTQTSGGTAGTSTTCPPALDGHPGGAGQGAGDGESNGGGGWFGGGSGAVGGVPVVGGNCSQRYQGGGGGGSSFIEPGATNTSSTAGANSNATGHVTISW